MRALTTCLAVAIMLGLAGVYVLAQEIIAAPDPIGGTRTEAGTNAAAGVPAPSSPAPNAAAASNPDSWRYRWFSGRWWYWTPQNRWMWYSDDGQWVPFDANHMPPVAAQSAVNPPGYQGEYYYTGPGYWTGYYPGVGVGVGPYGNVNVGVGRRVGVDVWGPHGGVRVGRIYVGW
jgi:hypothetical protein